MNNKNCKKRIIKYQYKAIGHLDFKKDIEIDFILPKIFKTPQETYKYKFKAFFTRESGEIVLKIEDKITKEIIEIIHWKEHWKYKTKIYNGNSVVASIKDLLDKKEFSKKEYEIWQEIGKSLETTIDNLPILDDSNYLPYSETFEDIFKTNNEILEEGQKYYFEVYGWDLIPLINADMNDYSPI